VETDPGGGGRWDEVKEIVADAFEVRGEERRRLVEERCGGDAALLAEVRSLLDEDESDSAHFLDRPATALLDVAAPEVGARVGGYELRAVIGEGGMGRVYEAVQERPHRTVALKVLRPGFLNAGAERRFEWEIEALGRLSHPNIASVFDAGMEDVGGGQALSWFAMEKVEGRPLLEAADALGLDRNERLRLFVRVADAITHAHQRGVIHRDLKPDNILVDDRAQPHVLDFGIARAADPLASAVTTTGEIVGTLAYMSPEQVLGDPQKVDAQSDVYALGVLLYQLLTGRSPLDLEGLSLPRVAVRLSETDPTPAGAIDRALRGDLETILATALARDPDRRYATVDAFAGDVKRHLAGETIAARPPSAWYQMSRFARRHRALVAAALIVFVASVAAAVTSSLALVEANEARVQADAERRAAQAAQRVAELQRDRAEDASVFLAKILSSPAPDLSGRDVRVLDLLEDASAELWSRTDIAPEVSALLHHTLGETYRSLEAFEPARAHLEEAIRAFEGSTPDELSALEAHAALAEVLFELNEPEAARRSTARVAAGLEAFEDPPLWLTMRPLELEAAAAAFRGDTEAQIAATRALFDGWSEHVPAGGDVVETARTNLSNALITLGRYEEADALLAEGIAAMEGTPLDGGVRQLAQMANRASIACSLAEWNRADALTEELVDLAAEVWGPTHQATRSVWNTRADVLIQLGRIDEGKELYREVMVRTEEALGSENDDTLLARNNYAVALLYAGEHGAARAVILPCVEILDSGRVSAGPTFDVQVRMTYANALDGLGRHAEVLPVYRRIVGELEGLAGEGHPQTLISRNSLAVLLMKVDRAEESVALARENIAVAEAHMPGLRLIEFPFRSNLARALAAAERYGEAEAELLAVARFLEADPEATERETDRVAELLVDLYTAWGRPEDAARWRDR